MPKWAAYTVWIVVTCVVLIVLRSITLHALQDAPAAEAGIIRFIIYSFIYGSIAYAFFRIMSHYSNKTEEDELESLNDQTSDDSNEFYAAAWDEVSSGDVCKEVWSKAFVLAKGDDAKTKAIYIKERVKQLSSTYTEDQAESEQVSGLFTENILNLFKAILILIGISLLALL